MRRIGWVALGLFIGTIVAANWAIDRYGPVHVLGIASLVAPAGVYFAGLAFTLRDVVHDTLGRWWVLAAIALGAALSWWISDAVTIPGGHASIAVASGLAFALSELADFAVYEPLRHRQWDAAVWASGLVGAVVDSALFLWLAFGGLDFLKGQVVGKMVMVGAAWLLYRPVRVRLMEGAHA